MKVFNLPDLGEGLTDAEIREWYVKVGDEVKVDQPVVSMETAKALVDVPSPYHGKIKTLHGKPGDIIETGSPLISFESEGNEKTAEDQGSVVGQLEKSDKKWQENMTLSQQKKTTVGAIKAMPAARVLAKEMQIDINQIQPTGPNGLITVDDVKNAFATKDSSHHYAPAFQFSGEKLRGVRRMMAETMTLSQHIVPVSIFDDANITHFPPKHDFTVTIIQSIIHAVKEEPSLNAWFNGSTLERKLFHAVHMGLAVDSDEGLFVPVIKEAQTLSRENLRSAIDACKDAIKARSLSADKMQGATITLSNFGMMAGRYATPIIVPPMVAIIALGRLRETPLISEDQVKPGRILPLSLTFDHRAVTGGEATRFLGAMIQFLETK